MKNLALVLVLLLIVVGGVWAAANFAFAQTKVETDTVFGTVREIVVKSDRGDVDLLPASKLIEVRETAPLGGVPAQARADAQERRAHAARAPAAPSGSS